MAHVLWQPRLLLEAHRVADSARGQVDGAVVARAAAPHRGSSYCGSSFSIQHLHSLPSIIEYRVGILVVVVGPARAESVVVYKTFMP